jgi:DNA-binding MarR family transcriptional regulator
MAAHGDLDIGLAFARIARAQRTKLAKSLAGIGLHPGQEQLLLALYEEDGMHQARLAEVLGIEAPTVTKMLQRLEAAGFVERTAHPSDGRALCVHLTPAGSALRRDVRRIWSTVNRQALKGLSDRQQSTLRTTLASIAENLGDPLV